MKPTLLPALAALAATSCSLQLDSQYGLRWDPNVRVQKHQSPDAEPIELAAASTNQDLEGYDSFTEPAQSTNVDTDAWEFSSLPSAADNSATSEERIVFIPRIQQQAEDVTSRESSREELPVATDLEVKSKNTLANLAGNVVMLLGAFFLLATFFTISVMSAYGASFAGVLFSLLLAGIGILLVVAGYRLRRR